MYKREKRQKWARDKRGRFAHSRRINKLAFVTILLALGVLIFHYGGGEDKLFEELDKDPIVVTKTVDLSAPKIEKMKWDIVEELASKCETYGVPKGRANATTIMDTNGYYSRGRWQFQAKTVQYYYKKFYKKEISVDEAVLIAHTEEKARQLAYDIIWKEIGGIYNWANCERKLGLKQKIEIIRKLDN